MVHFQLSHLEFKHYLVNLQSSQNYDLLAKHLLFIILALHPDRKNVGYSADTRGKQKDSKL